MPMSMAAWWCWRLGREFCARVLGRVAQPGADIRPARAGENKPGPVTMLIAQLVLSAKIT